MPPMISSRMALAIRQVRMVGWLTAELAVGVCDDMARFSLFMSFEWGGAAL